MQESGLIVSNPKVMLGKLVIRGTRITVELILQKFAADCTEEKILLAHPNVTPEGIRAALAFAGEALQSSVIYPLERAASLKLAQHLLGFDFRQVTEERH